MTELEFLKDWIQDNEIWLLEKADTKAIESNSDFLQPLTKQIDSILRKNFDIKDKNTVAIIQFYWKIKWAFSWKIDWKHSKQIDKIAEQFRKENNIEISKLDLSNWLSEQEFNDNIDILKKLSTKDLLKNPKTFDAINAQVKSLIPMSGNKFMKTRDEVNKLVENSPYLSTLIQIYGKMVWIDDEYKLVKLDSKSKIKPILDRPISWIYWENTQLVIKYIYDFWSENKNIKCEVPGWERLIRSIDETYNKSNLEKYWISINDVKALVFIESWFNDKVQSVTWSAGAFQITNNPIKDMLQKLNQWDLENNYETMIYNRELIIENLFTDQQIVANWKKIFAQDYDKISNEYKLFKKSKDQLSALSQDIDKISKDIKDEKAKLNNKWVSTEEKKLIKERITQLDKTKKILEEQEKSINKNKNKLVEKIRNWLKAFLIKKNQFPINWNTVIWVAELEYLAKNPTDYKGDTQKTLEQHKNSLFKSVANIVWKKEWVDSNGNKFNLRVNKEDFFQLIADIKTNKDKMYERFNVLKSYNWQNNKYHWEIISHKNIYALAVLYISKYYKEALPK